MSKKPKSKANASVSTVNQVTVEIDYDKLADAIVKAKQKANEQEKNNTPDEKRQPGFFRAIYLVFRNKNETDDRLTTGFMALPIMVVFKTLSGFGLIISVLGIWGAITTGIAMVWNWDSAVNNVFTLLSFAFILFIVFMYSVIMWGAANELEKTKDKHFVAAVFSGVISLVALIVSLIALLK